jgi:hypothetical protein
MLDLTLLMGVNFMLFSRIGLSSLIVVSLLAVSGLAVADDGYYDGYGYNSGVYVAPVPVVEKSCCGWHGWHHKYQHHYRHHMMARNHHPMYMGFYMCKKYTYEVTPIHRDVACTKWKFVCRHGVGYKDGGMSYKM